VKGQRARRANVGAEDLGGTGETHRVFGLFNDLAQIQLLKGAVVAEGLKLGPVSIRSVGTGNDADVNTNGRSATEDVFGRKTSAQVVLGGK
jgi:hypothetical protein